jgi:hypothetical protein
MPKFSKLQSYSNSLLNKLVFVATTNIHEPVCCNSCNKVGLPINWLICTLYPFKDGSDIQFIVCGEQCRSEWVGCNQTEIDILMTVVEAGQRFEKEVTKEYISFIIHATEPCHEQTLPDVHAMLSDHRLPDGRYH